MRRLCLLVFCLLCLCSCDSHAEEPATPLEDTTPTSQEETQLPSTASDQNQNLTDSETSLDSFTQDPNAEHIPIVQEPEYTPEELNVVRMNNTADYFNSIYRLSECPTFYPVNEETLDELREWCERVNKDFPEFQFDIYSIVPHIYGYSVEITTTWDSWDHLYRLWLEVLPDDTMMPRATLVSCGPDGRLDYQGAGVDYSSTGFGDDIIKFLNYN